LTNSLPDVPMVENGEMSETRVWLLVDVLVVNTARVKPRTRPDGFLYVVYRCNETLLPDFFPSSLQIRRLFFWRLTTNHTKKAVTATVR